MKYKAILFHPEGDFVTDFRSHTIADVWSHISQMGSKWIFYPICLVGTSHTIVDTPPGLEFLKRKRITTAQRYMSDFWKHFANRVVDGINSGIALNAIYHDTL
jgi:hypothetical protein